MARKVVNRVHAANESEAITKTRHYWAERGQTRIQIRNVKRMNRPQYPGVYTVESLVND